MQQNMEFMVVGRQEIEDGLLLRAPHVIISIADPGSPQPKIRPSGLCRGILRLRFHDAEPTEGFISPPEIKQMTQQQALAIWQFVLTHLLDIKLVVVHCEAGMSRSPAVAAAICRGLGGDDSRFFQEYQPNMLVYRLLLEAKPTTSD
jgi:predicted protein tyrosine phosphatase